MMRRPTYPGYQALPRRHSVTTGCNGPRHAHERSPVGQEHRADTVVGPGKRDGLHICRSVHYGYRGWRGAEHAPRGDR